MDNLVNYKMFDCVFNGIFQGQDKHQQEWYIHDLTATGMYLTCANFEHDWQMHIYYNWIITWHV